jgi:hypothetical protein
MGENGADSGRNKNERAREGGGILTTDSKSPWEPETHVFPVPS